MKKILMAMVAALALVGTTVQEASAWCKFNFSTGVNIGLETSGGTRTRGGYTPTDYPPPYAPTNPGFAPPVAYAAPGAAFAPPAAYPTPAPAFAPSAGAAPSVPPVPAPTPAGTSAAPSNNGVTQAAYLAYYYEQYSAPPSSPTMAAPSYWYGD